MTHIWILLFIHTSTQSYGAGESAFVAPYFNSQMQCENAAENLKKKIDLSNLDYYRGKSIAYSCVEGEK